MMMYINYQRESGRLVTYNPPAPEGEHEVEEDGAGRENFLCLSEVSHSSNAIPLHLFFIHSPHRFTARFCRCYRLEKMAEELENNGGNIPVECLGQLQPTFGPLGRNGVRTNPFRHHANA